MSSNFSSGIQCLSLVARFHQIPAEPSALLREFQFNDADDTNSPLADINLVRAAKSLGFKAKFITDTTDKLSEHVLPAIARHIDGHFFIIIKVNDDEILVQDMLGTGANPTTYTHTELNACWTGDLLLLSKRSSLISSVMTDSAKFGFSWFIPALIKYKTYFGDVFVASFFIQLVGLASPIFFQVVIDKVLVHKGMTTLDVLAVGFFIVITFEVVLTQYLELKQQRIDQEETLLLQRAKVEQINASIESAKHNLYAYLSESRRNTLQEINQLTRQSESTNQELTKANRLTQLRVLTSPVDGIVEELVIATIGGVVTPAQELLHIVPIGEYGRQQLEVEAGLLNKDIGFVHTGQIVEIKIDSFPFTKYGVIDGEVTGISADAIEHEQLGLLFPLKASLATDEINVNGKWVKLKPGMSVTVEIKTGTRRLMEFLLAPLMRGVSEGARER